MIHKMYNDMSIFNQNDTANAIRRYLDEQIASRDQFENYAEAYYRVKVKVEERIPDVINLALKEALRSRIINT